MNQAAIIQKQVVEDVMTKISIIQDAGGIRFPADYSVENAIQAAGLIISKTEDKNNKPALEVCSRESIANSLLYMVTQGLNPIKNQCYFIVYGKDLVCQRSYHGSVTLAKRFSEVKEVTGQTIYDQDDFIYEVDIKTGRKTVVKHGQKLENIDFGKIKGAYAIAVLSDGTVDVEVMNMMQIKNSWLMGKMKGASKAHTNFTDEMCEKTVINRLCKKYIDSSNDSVLIPQGNQEQHKALEGDRPKPNSMLLVEGSSVEDEPADKKKRKPKWPEGKEKPTENAKKEIPKTDEEIGKALEEEEKKNMKAEAEAPFANKIDRK